MIDINKSNNFQEFFRKFGGMEISLTSFKFRNLPQLLNSHSCPDSGVLLFPLKRWIRLTFKNGKCQLLKITRSRYINILIKSYRGLELVFTRESISAISIMLLRLWWHHRFSNMWISQKHTHKKKVITVVSSLHYKETLI